MGGQQRLGLAVLKPGLCEREVGCLGGMELSGGGWSQHL